MRTLFGLTVVTVLLTARVGYAQSINVNFAGSLVGGPKSGYAAAGLAGIWNVIEGLPQGTHFTLKNLDEVVTPASVYNIGGSALVTTNHPGTIRDDQDLLDNYLITYNPNLEVCLFFNDLEDGAYEIITYAWLPDQPLIDSYVTVDNSGNPAAMVGGAWAGAHQPGVTFTVHQVNVAGGYLYSHSGIVPASGNPSAALNGVQLRKLNPTTPEDIDGDDDVDLADYSAFDGCHEGPGNIGWRPLCPDFDDDGDQDVDLADFAHFQSSFDEA